MNKTIRSVLLLLLLPVVIVALYLESGLMVSSGVHEILQMMIVLAACWLAWRWVILDEVSSLREIHQGVPVRDHVQLVSSAENTESVHQMLVSWRFYGKVKAAGFRAAYGLMSVGIVFALNVVMLLIGSKILGQGVIAILLLIPIGWCTVRWGRLAGVSAAMTAALSFDFLFIPPFGTFNIGSLEGWLLLFLFVATAILVVGRVQSILAEESEREHKATFLFELTVAILDQTTLEGIAKVIADQIQRYFLAESVKVRLVGGGGYARTADRRTSAPTGKPDRVIPIILGSEMIGEIQVWRGIVPLPEEGDPMLQTMLKQIAVTINWVSVASGTLPYPNPKPAHPDESSLQVSHP